MQNFFFFARDFLSQEISKFSAFFCLAAILAVLAGCGSGSTAMTPAVPLIAPPLGTTGPALTLELTDAAGAKVNAISVVAPGTAKATLKNTAGAVVPNSVVTFSTDSTLATITPAATALTDASGVATVKLNAATITAVGATNITATAQVGTPAAAVTGSIGFAVGAAAVTITAPATGVGAASLSAFGTTSIAVMVSVGGVPVSTPQNVTFSSACGNSGKAVLSTSVATVAGVATGSYRDNGCAGTDVITATAAGVTSASTNLVVTPPTTGSIQFVSATPSSISLKGTGGVETSQVAFKVVDTGGNPVSGKTVTFGLSTAAGGIALTPSIAGVSTAISDATGQVVINVNAGTVNTPVRVTASTAGATGTTLTTQSNVLTVTTGIPAQDSFSLSATKLNPEFRDIDGNTTVLTARLADHFRNPVPDGTAVNFTAEGGSIVGSCQTVGGACSAVLTSQNPRPADGRATVLAYAVGEESFIDLNGNGVADLVPNEMVDLNGVSTDLPEAFRDDNENGVRDANETFIDFNKNGVYDGGDGKFNGVLCDPAISSPGTCAASRSIHVRGQLVIVFSGSTALITLPAGINLNDGGGLAGCSGPQIVSIGVVDSTGNVMPVGTTIDVKTTNGKLGTNSFVVGNTNQLVTPPYITTIQGDGSLAAGACTDATLTGVLTVTVTTPGGSVTSRSIAVVN